MRLGVDDGQTQPLLKSLEIPVAMKQGVPLTQAERRDQAVDSFPNGVAAASKGSIVSRGVASQRHASCREHLQLQQLLFSRLRRRFVAEALQHFAQDDVGQPQTLPVELPAQPRRLRVSRALQIVDPDRGVDDDHAYFAVRPRRDALRSPFQATLPRNRRILPCPLVRTSRCSASSTTARFVFPSLPRMAWRIRLSSMSMFVLMPRTSMCKIHIFMCIRQIRRRWYRYDDPWTISLSCWMEEAPALRIRWDCCAGWRGVTPISGSP